MRGDGRLSIRVKLCPWTRRWEVGEDHDRPGHLTEAHVEKMLGDMDRCLPAWVWVEHLGVRGHNDSRLWKPIRGLLVRFAMWVLRRDGLTIIERRTDQ